MKTELAFSLGRDQRLIERNFWFAVETRNPRGWRTRFITRDRKLAEQVFELACNGLIGAYGYRHVPGVGVVR